MKGIRRIISFLLALVMVIGMVPPMAVSAEETEPTQAVTEAIEETTEPTETVTEPVEETTMPTESPADPMEETTAPTEAVTEPAEESTTSIEENVTEAILVESVTISQEEGLTELAVGDTLQLAAAVLPEDATEKTVVWSSSDEARAIVDESGNVTALSAGKVSIYATCGDQQETYTIDIVEKASVTVETEVATGVAAGLYAEEKSILIHFYNSDENTIDLHVQISDEEWEQFPLSENVDHPGWYDVNVADTDGIITCYFTVGDTQTEMFTIDITDGTAEFWYLNGELVSEEPFLWNEPPVVAQSKEIVIHFYNSEEWAAVNAFIQDSAESDNEYPGISLSQNEEHKNWYDVTVVDNDGSFSCTFNDGTKQTDTLSVEYSEENTEFWYLNNALMAEAPELWTAPPPEVTRSQWI